MNNWRNNPLVFNWLLIMTGVALPFPDYSLVSKFIILFVVYWLFFYNSIQDKIYNLKRNKLAFFSISILFFLPVLGLLYSDNLESAFNDLALKQFFFILPLVIFSIPDVLPFKTLHKYFAYSVSLVSLSAIIQALYFKYHFGVDFTFYHEFSHFTNKHTTYFGIFLTLSILYFIWKLLEEKKYQFWNLSGLLVLFVTLYINGNRMSLLATLVSVSILVFYRMTFKFKLGFGFGLLLALFLFTKTDFYQSRVQTLSKEINGHNELTLRKKHWQAVLSTIKHNNICFGSGTESHREFLYEKYRKAGNVTAFLEKYNAHNQFLEISLDFGLLGLLSFLLAIIYHLWLIIENRQHYFLAIYFSIFMFMLTESILERQNGIIIWTLFISMMLRIINDKNVSLTENNDKKVRINKTDFY